MKYLGMASFVIGVEIHYDRSCGIVGLSQNIFIEKILSRFDMQNCAFENAPIAKCHGLSLLHCPKNNIKKERMEDISYVSVLGSLMYTQICTHLDIAHKVGMLGRYLSNLGMDH